MNKEWIEITVLTSSEAVEPVSGLFYTCGLQGVSIMDIEEIKAIKANKTATSYDYFEDSLLDMEDSAIIKGYFEDDEQFKGYLEYITKGVEELKNYGFDIGRGKVLSEKVNQSDWENIWKKYYKPTKISDRIVVKPQWEEYTPKKNELVLEMDPGMAFGTGTHETTRLCLRALEKYVDEESTVFDIGTGSGILSIAASKLGAKKAIGVDLDEIAVESAKRNVKLNKIDNVEILYGNLMEVVKGKADIVVANIMADIVMLLGEQVRAFMKDEGIFVSSGILVIRAEEVKTKLEECGFDIIDIIIDGEWCSIIAK